MTNSSGFGQTEEEKRITANNLAQAGQAARDNSGQNNNLYRTSNALQNSAQVQEYLTGLELRDEGRGTGSITSETDDLKTTYLPDQSFGDQALLQELTNKQNMLNMEVAAELDRVNTEFFTDLDIRKAQAVAGETRAGQRVGGEETRANLAEGGAQTRATSRVAGQEQRAGYAEQGSQLRATERVRGQEDRGRTAEEGQQTRATTRVAGQEQRAGYAEQGSQARGTRRVEGQEERAGIAEGGQQTRATRRVEGQEVRETDLQREMFRRYKEARDYGQAQTAYKA
tara:strand:- start:135 stop:986 length:852 start_codon:yes stop_codon:yes gene_type:complete